MSIHNKQFVADEEIDHVKLNEISDDANNSTNNIHPQYLDDFIDASVFRIWMFNDGVAKGFSCYYFPPGFAAENFSALPAVAADYIAIQRPEDGSTGPISAVHNSVFFVKGKKKSINIYGNMRMNVAGTASGCVVCRVYSIDNTGAATLLFTSGNMAVTADTTWRNVIYDGGVPIDISAVADGNKIQVVLQSTVNVSGSVAGPYIAIDTMNLTVTPNLV